MHQHAGIVVLLYQHICKTKFLLLLCFMFLIWCVFFYVVIMMNFPWQVRINQSWSWNRITATIAYVVYLCKKKRNLNSQVSHLHWPYQSSISWALGTRIKVRSTQQCCSNRKKRKEKEIFVWKLTGRWRCLRSQLLANCAAPVRAGGEVQVVWLLC